MVKNSRYLRQPSYHEEWVVWTKEDGIKFCHRYIRKCKEFLEEFFGPLGLKRPRDDGKGGWIVETKMGITYYIQRRRRVNGVPLKES